METVAMTRLMFYTLPSQVTTRYQALAAQHGMLLLLLYLRTALPHLVMFWFNGYQPAPRQPRRGLQLPLHALPRLPRLGQLVSHANGLGIAWVSSPIFL